MKPARPSHLVYALPLIGLLAGAVMGFSVLKIKPLAEVLARAGGQIIAPMINRDNLAMIGGLAGLMIFTALAARVGKKYCGAGAEASPGKKSDQGSP